MARFDRSALALGVATLALTLGASSMLWWRWERSLVVLGDVPLPPRSRLVEPLSEGDAVGSELCQVTAYTPFDSVAVESFFADELALRGWSGPEPGVSPRDPRATFRSGNRVLRLALRPRPESGRTHYTLTVRPCLPS